MLKETVERMLEESEHWECKISNAEQEINEENQRNSTAKFDMCAEIEVIRT